ncbi:DegT/DnrJ/EryC1/StrS family aminotransferase [Vibrio sp. WXL210]|uniref:DegT/DnrJ/EryC1/StrS family aminotransferase n=1 Tax=Vibrio sp. WXL210 TaxID=3450709 RepID=UPI003EC51924
MITLNSPIKPNLKKLTPLLEKINENGWYTNFGPMYKELTEKLEDYLGVENLLLMNNGTTALQVAGRALGSKSVISTPFSFVATVSAFKWQKDELCFADIDPHSLNLSPAAVEMAYRKGCKADTLVATHVYGNPCDVDLIDNLSMKNNFKVIYDAAHAFGVNLKGKSLLGYGDASTLSFHATKVFHTVEGGAVVFKDRDDFEIAREIINFGIKPGKNIVNVGINAKMNEYQAAVGLVNLADIDDVITHRQELFFEYRKGLQSLVELPEWHPEATANGAYMPILLESNQQVKKLITLLSDNGVESRHYFSPSLDRVYIDSHSYGTKVSNDIAERILCLPMHAHLSMSDVNRVIEVLKVGLGD